MIQDLVNAIEHQPQEAEQCKVPGQCIRCDADGVPIQLRRQWQRMFSNLGRRAREASLGPPATVGSGNSPREAAGPWHAL